LEHPWFSDIKFGLLEGCFIDPPFKPSKTASSNIDTLRHISQIQYPNKNHSKNFPTEYDDLLVDFPFYSAKVWQREIVTMFEEHDQNYLEQAYKNVHVEESQIKNFVRVCCSIM